MRPENRYSQGLALLTWRIVQVPHQAGYLVQPSLLWFLVQPPLLPVKMEIARLQELSKGLVWRCLDLFLNPTFSSSTTLARLDSWYRKIKTRGPVDQTPMSLWCRTQEMELLCLPAVISRIKHTGYKLLPLQ